MIMHLWSQDRIDGILLQLTLNSNETMSAQGMVDSNNNVYALIMLNTITLEF